VTVYSQNGWVANDRSRIKVWTIPGTTIRLSLEKNDGGFVLTHFLEWFAKVIEPIDLGRPDDWGYAERNIVGGKDVSNHASGTAFDVNSLKHPLGAINTFDPRQRAMIRNKLLYYDGCIRWGGDYNTRKDDMHFEINRSPLITSICARRIRLEQLDMAGLTKEEHDAIIETRDLMRAMMDNPLDHRYHHMAVPDNIFGHVLAIRKLVDELILEPLPGTTPLPTQD
jgi:hypothetical protein